MKPIGTNNISVWGYIGLFLLFSMPYIGTPALIICAIFARNDSVRNFARALLLLTLICLVLIIVLLVMGVFALSDFGFSDNGVELFNYVRGFAGL